MFDNLSNYFSRKKYYKKTKFNLVYLGVGGGIDA